MSTKIVIKTTDRVVPMIYAYTTPEIARHNGWTKIGYTEQDVKNNNLGDLKNKVARDGAAEVAASIGVGEMTLSDIVEEILKPGRDVRDSLTPPTLRADLMDIKDLKEGMELTDKRKEFGMEVAGQ